MLVPSLAIAEKIPVTINWAKSSSPQNFERSMRSCFACAVNNLHIRIARTTSQRQLTGVDPDGSGFPCPFGVTIILSLTLKFLLSKDWLPQWNANFSWKSIRLKSASNNTLVLIAQKGGDKKKGISPIIEIWAALGVPSRHASRHASCSRWNDLSCPQSRERAFSDFWTRPRL